MSSEIETIDSLWEKASIRFRQRTEKNLKSKSPRTFDQVRMQLETMSTSTSFELPTSAQQSKQAGLNLLYFLKVIGGVAAQAASQVFGPADLCFNAVSMLLDIPSKIAEFHELINSLFSEIHDALAHFKIYQRIEKSAGLDYELIQTANEVMISFVDICALSINLQSGGKLKHTWRDAKRILCDDDSGIKKELDTFKARTSKQGDMERTLTLEHAIKNGEALKNLGLDMSDMIQMQRQVVTGVGLITEIENNKKLDQKQNDDKKLILEKLSLTDTIDSGKQNALKLYATSVKGTACWMWKMAQYQEWAHATTTSQPVLLLVGAENTGKSYLTSAMFYELQSGDSRRVVGQSCTKVAYYSFKASNNVDETAYQSSKAANNVEKMSNNVEVAMRSLVYQLSEQDRAYQARIASQLKREREDAPKIKDMKCKELWRDLLSNYRTPGNTYFLLLDGIDHLSEEVRQKLLDTFAEVSSATDTILQGAIRTLLVGQQGTFQVYPWSECPRIEVEENNESDIQAFIEKNLEDLGMLRGQDDASEALSKQIHDRLPSQAKGDYAKIQRALDKISHVVSLEDLDAVIDEAGQTAEEMAGTDLEDLEKRLSSREIEELNELLTWVICHTSWLTTERLEAALYLRFDTAPLPLERKIRGKYSKVLTDEDGGVDCRPGIMERVKTTARTFTSDDDTPRISATIKIINANETTVQNFLWTLCEKATIDKFRFDSTTSATLRRNRIQVNEFEGLLHVVKQTFEVLSGDPDEKTSELVQPSIQNLPRLLKKLHEDPQSDRISQADKREIVRNIVSLLRETDWVDLLWDAQSYSFHSWSEVGAFWSWLEDDSTSQFLDRSSKRWLTSVKKETNPKKALLTPMATTVAKYWLRDRDRDAEDAYRCLRMWLSAFEDPTSDQNESDKADEEPVLLEPNVMLRVSWTVDWARELLKIPRPDALWHERLGETCLALGEYSAAVEYFREGTVVDKTSWRCYEALACAVEMQADSTHAESYASELETAAREMTQAVDILLSQKDDSGLHGNLVNDIVRLAKWYVKLERPEAATALCDKFLQLGSDNRKAQSKLLGLLLDIGYQKPAWALIQESSTQTVPDAEISQLGEMLKSMITETHGSAFLRVLETVQEDAMLALVLEHLQKVRAYAKNDPNEQAKLLLYEGIALYRYERHGAAGCDAALSLWQQCYELTGADDFISNKAVERVCIHHLHHARMSDNSDLHVEKLRQLVHAASTGNVSERYRQFFLASYLIHAGQREEAKQLVRADILEALEILSDEYDWNDSYGYSLLADAFTKYHDDSNALTAWSLRGPNDLGYAIDVTGFKSTYDYGRTLLNAVASQMSADTTIREVLTSMIEQIDTYVSEVEFRAHLKNTIEKELSKDDKAKLSVQLGSLRRERRIGEMGCYCDGFCGKTWSYADDIYQCKFCRDVQFCEDCLQKRRTPGLKMFMCHPGHDWLHVPAWDDKNFANMKADKVWTGGEIRDGVRVGGTLVEVKEWIRRLKEEWGFRRPGGNITNGA